MTTDTAAPRKSPWKVLIPIAAILVLVVAALTLLKSQLPEPAPSDTEIQEGSTVGDLTFPQFRGGEQKLSALPGKVTLINFWASWCEACMYEIPSILKLNQTYKDKGLNLVFINVDDNPEAVLPATLKKLGITFPVYLDPKNALAEKFDVHAIPLTVIVDKKTKVLLLETGERDWNGADIRKLLDGWISG